MPTGPALSAAGRRLKARRAILARHRGPHHPDTVAAESDYRTEVLAEHIRKVAAAAPPLSADQIEQLRGLLPYPHPSAPEGDREAISA